MGQKKKSSEADIDALLKNFEKKQIARNAKKERDEIKKALKQLILRLCWAQQATKLGYIEDIPYFICKYVDIYAKGDKALLQELLDFYNTDCKQGARPIEYKNFTAAIITINEGKKLAVLNEEFELIDEGAEA